MDFRRVRRSGVAFGAALAIGASGLAVAAPHGDGRPMSAPFREPSSREVLRDDTPSHAEAEPHADPLGKLFAATPAQVRARFGDPDVSRSEGKGAFWTYRMPNCALFLFFQDGPKGLRVSGASTGPRKRGEPTPTVEACLAQAIETSE